MQDFAKYSILDKTDFRLISDRLKKDHNQSYSVDYIRQLLRGYVVKTDKCELVFKTAQHQLTRKIDKILDDGI